MSVKIYVPLVGDGADGWRPVRARSIVDDVYEILDQAYDRRVERWRFEPGEHVVCEQVDADGQRILRAQQLSNDDPGRPISTPRFGLFILGVRFVGLNVVFPASRATAERISGAAWPIGGAFMVAVALIDSSGVAWFLTPLGGGVCLALAVLLALDPARGHRLLGWEETGRPRPLAGSQESSDEA